VSEFFKASRTVESIENKLFLKLNSILCRLEKWKQLSLKTGYVLKTSLYNKNGRDLQRKNVANNVDMSSLRAP